LGAQVAQSVGNAGKVFVGVGYPQIDIEGQHGLMPKQEIHPADQNGADVPALESLEDCVNIHAGGV
jgi:hypothetical protein